MGLLWAAALAPFFLVGIWHPVQNLNEGLYARVAQEMLEHGNFIVPTLDGVPYLEKPPLLYWITALGIAVFGRADAVTRLAPMLGVLLMLLAVHRFAARAFPQRSRATVSFVLVSAPIVVVLARTLLFDALLTGLLALALVAFHEWWVTGRRGLLRASYALLALAILTKGFVALALYGLIVLSFAAFERRLPWRAMFEPGAVAACVALVLPWHLAATLEQPGFAWFYFINEHLLRFLGVREPHDYQTGPPWYYLPRMFADLFPWVLALLIRPDEPVDPSPRARSARRFLVLWVALPLAFFSLAGNKGEYYLIVAIPALALLAAERIGRIHRRLQLLPAAWLIVLGVICALLGMPLAPYALPDGTKAWLVVALALASLSLAALRAHRRSLGIAACAAVVLPLAVLFSSFMTGNAALKSARPLAEAITALHPARVYAYRDFERSSSLAWYLDRPIGIVDSDSRDLWYGMRLKPDVRRFPSSTEFMRANVDPGTMLVVREVDLRALSQGPLARRFAESGTVGHMHILVWRPAARGCSGRGSGIEHAAGVGAAQPYGECAQAIASFAGADSASARGITPRTFPADK